MGLVERAGQVEAAIGQTKARAAPDMIGAYAQLRDAFFLLPLRRADQMDRIHARRNLEEQAVMMPIPPGGGVHGPRRILLRNAELFCMGRLVDEPLTDLEGEQQLFEWRPEQLLQPRKQRIAVKLGRLFRLDLLGRLPLDEFALDPEQRFELRVVPFQRGELGAHAKELAYECLELWRDPQGQVGGGGAGDVGRMAAGLHQLLVQLRIGLGKLREKDLIEPDQALAPVQVGDREPVRKDRHFCSIHIRTG